MKTTNLPKDYESAIKVIETFVKDIFAGSDENQKKDLHQNLLVLAKLYTPSNMTKKRPSECDINEIFDEKETKFESIESDTNFNQIEKKDKFEPFEVKTYVNQVEGKNGILPEEIWLKIMYYLKTKDLFLNFGLVCKCFKGLTLDSRAIKYLELKKICDRSRYNQVMKVINQNKHIKEFQIESSEKYWTLLMSQALKNSNLKSLKILFNKPFSSNDYNIIELDDAQEIVKFGKNLENLEIDSLLRVTSEAFDEISKLKNLKSLRLGNFSFKSLINIAKNCQQLENLSISRITDFKWSSKSSHESLIEAFDILFNERKDTLKKLRYDNSLNYENIKNLFRNIRLCQNLEQLAINVNDVENFNCESISQLKRLKELTIFACSRRKNQQLASLIKSMDVSQMKHLTLFDVGDYAGNLFETISNIHFPVLERLHMQSSGYSDKAVEALLNNCPNLKSGQLYLSFHHIRAHESCSESISIHTLVNYSIKRGIYIRVILFFKKSLDFLIQLSKVEHLHKTKGKIFRIDLSLHKKVLNRFEVLCSKPYT